MIIPDSSFPRFCGVFRRLGRVVVQRTRPGGWVLVIVVSGMITVAEASPTFAGQPPAVDPNNADEPSEGSTAGSRATSRASRFPNTPVGRGGSGGANRANDLDSSGDDAGLDSSARASRSRGSRERGRFRASEPELGSRDADLPTIDPLRRPRVGLGMAATRQRLGLPGIATTAGRADAPTPTARSGSAATRIGGVSNEFLDRAARYRAALRDRALRERDPERRAEWTRRLREFDAKLREVLERRRSGDTEEQAAPPAQTDRPGGGQSEPAPAARSTTSPSSSPSSAGAPRRPATDASRTDDAESPRTPTDDLPPALPPTPRRG